MITARRRVRITLFFAAAGRPSTGSAQHLTTRSELIFRRKPGWCAVFVADRCAAGAGD
jgi:hypothetical protein